MRRYKVEYKGGKRIFIADDAMEAFEIFIRLKPFGRKLVQEYNLLCVDKETSGMKWALYAAQCCGEWKRIKVSLYDETK